MYVSGMCVSGYSSSSLLTLGVQMLQYIKHVQGDNKITLQTKNHYQHSIKQDIHGT